MPPTGSSQCGAAFPAVKGHSGAPPRLHARRRAVCGAGLRFLRFLPLMAVAGRQRPSGDAGGIVRCGSKEVKVVEITGGAIRRARFVWVTALPPRTLREFAALAERSTRSEVIDPARAAAEIAEILEQGTRPTIGWWRRHTAR